jgi:hypothetical protein
MQHILLVLIFLIIGLKTSNGQCFKHVYEYDYDANGNRTSRLYHVISPCRVVFEDEIEFEALSTNTITCKTFPNPNNGRFTVEISASNNELPTALQTHIYDNSGRLIYKTEINDYQTFFNIVEMANGLYIVAITMENKIIHKETIVKF